MHKAKAAGLNKKPLDRNEWRAIPALIALFLPTTPPIRIQAEFFNGIQNIRYRARFNVLGLMHSQTTGQ
jgi:hypothetical protein